MNQPWTLDGQKQQIVLVPFDFSDASVDALTTARSLIAGPEYLYVLHVIPPLSSTSPGVMLGETDEKQMVQHADEALARALSAAGIGEARRRIHVGDPAAEIIDVARELDAALVVIPSRGKTGLRRWMIGSVAERVVRRAPCPVLVLPISAEDEEDELEGA